MKHQTLPIEKCLYLFIVLHVIAWTLTPYLVRFTLPMDAMEGAVWGQQFEWGYDKNPFLNGWLTSLAIKFGGTSGWAVYLFSQLSVAVCFWATWKLGKKILPPLYALIAVLLLEGVQYYNLHAIDLNDNTLELGLWALTTLFFYEALRKQTWHHWLLTGIFAALGMMTKYYTAMLLIPMALFLLIHPDNRKTFFNPKCYLGLFAFILITTPHIIWLFFHDFVTVDYALGRVSNEPNSFTHFNYAALFTWQQFETLLPLLLLGGFLLIGKKPIRQESRFILSSFDRQFLLYVGLGPFLLTILLSALTGIKLRAAWGQPLMSLWGVILIAWMQPRITRKRFYTFISLFSVLFVGTVASYAIALIKAKAPSSANFPGKIIAKTLTTEWVNTYHTPLTYVAGARWISGNIALYSPSRPSVYLNWDKKLSPWINEELLKKKGAIFVWDSSNDEKTPAEIKARFATLTPLRIMHFAWLRNKNMQPVKIGVAFLPPNNDNLDVELNRVD